MFARILEKARNFGLVKLVMGLVLLLFLILYLFKDEIKEHKVTRAKMEMFKRMTDTKPENWDEEFKQIYDSIIVDTQDSIGQRK